MILLGVDAGGSRSNAAAGDGKGTVLARGEGGPGAIRPGTAHAAAAAIATACRDAMQRARIEGPAHALVVGAAGAGREPERTELETAVGALRLAATVRVTTDAEIALAGAFADGPGIVLIAGTGSVAWARLPDGATARCGGLGPRLGDHGSGYDLGMAALRAAGLAAEGLGPATSLGAKLSDRLRMQVSDWPRWVAESSVADVSALAPDVIDEAQAGDAVARRLVEAGADFLARHARNLAQRFKGDVTVAMGGGLFKYRDYYRQLAAGRLQLLAANVTVAKEPLDAAAGALLLASRLG